MFYHGPSIETEREKYPLPWKLFFGTLIFALLCFGFYFISDRFLLPSLREKNQNLRVEIKSLGKEIDEESRKKVVLFWSQTQNLKKILKEHPYPTKLLDVIETLTPKGVKITRLNTDLEKGTLEIYGESDELNVAYFLASLEKNKDFSNVRIKSFGEGKFYLESNFDLNLVRF